MPAANFQTLEYDADQVRVTLGGTLISKGAGASGYAEGAFLKITCQPQFVKVVGTDGTVTRSKTNDRTFEATIRVMQSNSPTNGFLSTLMLLDVNAPNGAGRVAFTVQDMQGTTLFESSATWVATPPEQEWDRQAKEREWALEGVWDNIFVGGN